MKLKIFTVAAFMATACTSNDEQPAPAAEEPVAAESAELTDPNKTAEPAAADAKAEELAPEAAAEPKADEVVTEKSVSPGAAPAPAPAAESAEGLYVAVSHLNVRSGPGIQHPVVDVITFGSQHMSLGTENKIWVKIGEGRYTSRKYLSEQKLNEPMAVSAPQPVEAASQQEVAPQEAAPVEQAPVEQAPAEPTSEQPATEGSGG